MGKMYACTCDGAEMEFEALSAASAAERFATSLHAETDDFLGHAEYRVRVSLAGDDADGEVDTYVVTVQGEVRFTSSVRAVENDEDDREVAEGADSEEEEVCPISGLPEHVFSFLGGEAANDPFGDEAA